FLRIQQAEGGSRNDGLLHGHSRVFLRFLQVGHRVSSVLERTRCEFRQLARMSISEWNRDAAWRQRLEPMNWIRRKAGLRLLAVADDRRSGFFKPADRIANSAVISRAHLVLRDSARGELLHSVDQLGRPGNASDGFCGYCHGNNATPRASATIEPPRASFRDNSGEKI